MNNINRVKLHFKHTETHTWSNIWSVIETEWLFCLVNTAGSFQNLLYCVFHKLMNTSPRQHSAPAVWASLGWRQPDWALSALAKCDKDTFRETEEGGRNHVFLESLFFKSQWPEILLKWERRNTSRVKYTEWLYRTICRGQTAGSLETLVSSTRNGLVFNFIIRRNGWKNVVFV